MFILDKIKDRLSKNECLSILQRDAQAFDRTVSFAMGDDPYAWRAVWILKQVVTDDDGRIKPQVTKLIKAIPGKTDGHQRELIRLLYLMNLNDKQTGKLFDICIQLWEMVHKSSALRCNAFKFIHKTAEKYPELKNEIEFLTQKHYMDTLSPGVKRSIYKMIVHKNSPVQN